jgi:hypothetical protein
MRLSRRSFWRALPSGISRRVVRWKSTDISEEHVTSIFRVEETPRQAMSVTCFRCVILLGSFFDSEGSYVFLRNVGWLSTEYTELYRRRQNSALLISACTRTTQGTSTLNMTNGVTVASESELQTHTQHAGSRGKVSRLCSGGSWFESRPEHRLHWLKPFVSCISP